MTRTGFGVKSGVTSLEGVQCSRHTSVWKTDENVYQVKELVLKNWRITLCLDVGNFIWVSLLHFERKFEYASDFCQIRVPSAAWGAKPCQHMPGCSREASRKHRTAVTILLFPELKMILRDRRFNDITMIQGKQQRHSCQVLTCTSQMLWTVMQSLGLLHKIPRRLL